MHHEGQSHPRLARSLPLYSPQEVVSPSSSAPVLPADHTAHPPPSPPPGSGTKSQTVSSGRLSVQSFITFETISGEAKSLKDYTPENQSGGLDLGRKHRGNTLGTHVLCMGAWIAEAGVHWRQPCMPQEKDAYIYPFCRQ